MTTAAFIPQGETKARAKTRLFIALLYAGMGFFATNIYCASLKKVTRTGGDQGFDSAVNRNFDAINFELFNVMHKTSTETIRGYKYFVDPVDFGQVTADTATVTSISATNITTTNLTATTATITNLSTTSFVVGGSVFGLIPVGGMIMWGSTTTLPSKWINANGASLSTTTYSALFSVYGYTFGGSGANFNVPDYRGIFPKGAGTTDRAAGKDASGNFYAGTIGTYSTDVMQGHYHNVLHYGTEQSSLPTTNTGGAGNSNVLHGSGASDGQQIEVKAPRSDGTNGTPRTGHTTEPQSLGINFIIYTGK